MVGGNSLLLSWTHPMPGSFGICSARLRDWTSWFHRDCHVHGSIDDRGPHIRTGNEPCPQAAPVAVIFPLLKTCPWGPQLSSLIISQVFTSQPGASTFLFLPLRWLPAAQPARGERSATRPFMFLWLKAIWTQTTLCWLCVSALDR